MAWGANSENGVILCEKEGLSMALIDIIKGIAGAFAEEAQRNANRVERKCGSRLNQEQRARLDRAKKGAGRLKDWSRS